MRSHAFALGSRHVASLVLVLLGLGLWALPALGGVAKVLVAEDMSATW